MGQPEALLAAQKSIPLDKWNKHLSPLKAAEK